MISDFLKRIKKSPSLLDRQFLASQYISGHGVELGALHNPLPVNKKKAIVKYVDRMGVDDLKIQYPELNNQKLVPVDYIADGELLESIEDTSQDFVIANHFIEHCQNTILTMKNMIRVLKPGGVIFMAVPDKRFTFDKPRSITPLSHIVEDYQKGPAISREKHFKEWVKALNAERDDQFIVEESKKLMDLDYSIHFHVWTKSHMDELLVFLICEMKFDFEIELSFRKNNSNENIYVLRKLSN